MTPGLRSKWMFAMCCAFCTLAAVVGYAPSAFAENPPGVIPTYSTSFGKQGAGEGEFNGGAVYATTDGAGDVWITDGSNNRVDEFSPTGTFIREFGETGSGNGQFIFPAGISINKATGEIYVADYSHDRIEQFTSTGTFIRAFGTFGSGNGQLSLPYGVAVEPSGNVLVADSGNNRIEKFSSTGTFIATYGSAGAGNGQLKSPHGIALDPTGDMYIGDQGNNRVEELSPTGAYVTQFGTEGTGNGQFLSPNGVAIEPRTGNVFVADERNFRVQVFSPSGTYLGQFVSLGSGQGQTESLHGLTINSTGSVYVVDSGNSRVQIWTLPARLTGQPGWYSLQEESGGEPVTASVNVAGGNLMVESEDLPNETATANVRLDSYYNSQSTTTGGPLSPHWAWDAGPDLYLTDFGESVVLHGPSGYVVTLQRSGSTYTGPEEFEGTLTKNANGTYTLAEMSGITIQFNTNGGMTSYSNAEGKSFTVNDTTLSGQSVLHSLAPTTGKALEVAYSGTHVTTTTDPAGHIRHYEYNPQNELSVYTDPAGHKTEYGYETAGPLNKITTSNGTIETITTTAGKVTEVTITPKAEAAYKDKFEYVTPAGPTCSTTVDTGETIVTHPPEGGTPEIYCWEALGQVTAYSGPPTEAEEDPTEETGKEQPELPANTCYTNPNFPEGYCGQEDVLPENEEGGEGLFSPLVSNPDLGPTHYGIADNNTVSPFDIFTNPQFTALHVVNVRRTFPWNAVWEAKHSTIPKNKEVAEAEVTDFKTWVKDVKALGSNTCQPTVSFNYCQQGGEWVDPLEPAKHEPCTKAPTEPEYAAAVKEFLETETLKEVKYFSAWNEPNNNKIAGEPKGELAGEYWRALDTLCAPKAHNCLVAAGEFVDSAMTDANDEESVGGKYFTEYFKGMGHPPTAYRWAWHAYSDGEATYALRGTPSKWWKRFKNFRSAVDKVTKNTHKPDIWLTEQGAIYSAFDKNHGPAKNGHVATEIMHAYVEDGTNQLTRQSKQITRFFYYQVRGTPLGTGNWDSGLLYPTGTPRPRPMYWIYKNKTPKS
jgi:YD repeat-containing protein